MSHIETEYYQTQVGHLEDTSDRMSLCLSDYSDILAEIKGRWRDNAHTKIERTNILPLSDEYELFNSGVADHFEQCRSTSELLNPLNDTLVEINELFEQQEDVAHTINGQFVKHSESRLGAEKTLIDCQLKHESAKAKIDEALTLL